MVVKVVAMLSIIWLIKKQKLKGGGEWARGKGEFIWLYDIIDWKPIHVKPKFGLLFRLST